MITINVYINLQHNYQEIMYVKTNSFIYNSLCNNLSKSNILNFKN